IVNSVKSHFMTGAHGSQQLSVGAQFHRAIWIGPVSPGIYLSPERAGSRVKKTDAAIAPAHGEQAAFLVEGQVRYQRRKRQLGHPSRPSTAAADDADSRQPAGMCHALAVRPESDRGQGRCSATLLCRDSASFHNLVQKTALSGVPEANEAIIAGG